MANIPETVRTQVDSLTELIKNKKEISFEDAAKNLNLPMSTIEAWATFLEEEGVVSIKYKFTTPFFVYKKPKERIASDIAPLVAIDEISKLLKEIPPLIKNKKFNEAKQKQQDIKQLLANLPDEFKSEHSELIANIKEIEKKMDMLIMDFMSKGVDYEEKLNEYKYIDKEFEDRVEKLKSIASITKTALEKPGELPKYEEKIVSKEDINQMFNRVEFLLGKVKEYEKNNEYDKIEDTFLELNTRIKNLKTQLKSEIGLEKSVDNRLNTDLIDVDGLFERIKENLEKNNIEGAKTDIIKIHDLLKQIHFLLKTLFNEKKLIEKKEIRKAELDYIEPLFKKTYDYIKEGKFESAKQVYNQIEEKYRILPEEFLEKKKILKIDLIKLNRDLALGISEVTGKQLKAKINLINKLMKDTLNYIKKNDIFSATKAYDEIEGLYKEIPEGYLDEKTKLQNSILQLQEKLISKKRTIFFIDLQNKTKEIHSNLNKIKNSMMKGKIAESIDIYQKVREIFATLPQGFLPEKTDLQNRILDVYRQILYNKTNAKTQEVTQKSKQIDDLLKTIPNFVAKNDIGSANRVYEQVEQIYKSLPEGFLIQKSELQNKILKMSEEIAKRLDALSSKDFDIKYKRIEKMMKGVQDYIKKKDFDLAFAEYEEVVNIYNQLPPGFLRRKTELREKILSSYKNIMRGTDVMLLDKRDSVVAKRYDEMLQLLVRMHQYIENREFDLLETSYGHLTELYNNMSIGFLQQKTRIVEEVVNMHKKVELLERLRKAEGSIRQNNFEQLAKDLNDMYNLYTEMTGKSYEDRELFNYVYNTYSRYLGFLQGKGKAYRIKSPQRAFGMSDVSRFREKLSTTEKRLSGINLEYVEPVRT